MDKLTETIIKARQDYTAARKALAIAKEQLELIEAELFLSCDYKSLGSNESERKAKFDALKRADLNWQLAAHEVVSSEHQKDSSFDTLAAAEDCRRSLENALKAAYLEKQFGVIVNPDSFNIIQI